MLEFAGQVGVEADVFDGALGGREFSGLESGLPPKKGVPHREPDLRAQSAPAAGREHEVGEKPDCLRRKAGADPLGHHLDMLATKAIEEEERRDRVVAGGLELSRKRIGTGERDSLAVGGRKAGGRFAQHGRTGVDAVNTGLRRGPDEPGDETAIAFAKDEDFTTIPESIDVAKPRAFQIATERDELKRAIDGREPIEVCG